MMKVDAGKGKNRKNNEKLSVSIIIFRLATSYDNAKPISV